MTARDREHFRSRLEEMAARLRKEVSSLEGEALRPSGREPDRGGEGDTARETDPAQAEAAEELALHLHGPAVEVLTAVEAALDRLARGAFGRCEACGGAVARARLDALPYARRCVRCEARAESAEAARTGATP